MEDTIITIKAEHIIENVINKSRFIAHIKPVESVEDAKAFINQVSTKHREATHNCFAYTIGDQMNIQKANDNGEPSGTAGVPMLDILKKLEIHNACVVVTRYFGGIKLGAGGLIRAYGQSVSEGLNATGIVERKLMTKITTQIDYSLLGKVENEIRSSNYLLDEIEYLENVQVRTLVDSDTEESFIDWMTNIVSGQATITIGEQVYREYDV